MHRVDETSIERGILGWTTLGAWRMMTSDA
jgi:hypothetical protein